MAALASTFPFAPLGLDLRPAAEGPTPTRAAQSVSNSRYKLPPLRLCMGIPDLSELSLQDQNGPSQSGVGTLPEAEVRGLGASLSGDILTGLFSLAPVLPFWYPLPSPLAQLPLCRAEKLCQSPV